MKVVAVFSPARYAATRVFSLLFMASPLLKLYGPFYQAADPQAKFKPLQGKSHTH